MASLITVHIDVTEFMHGTESDDFVMLGIGFQEFGRVDILQVLVPIGGEVCIYNKEGTVRCLEGKEKGVEPRGRRPNV